MYKNVLASIPGIELYPILALCMFFGFFLGLMIWFVRADKQKLNQASMLPLSDSEVSTTQGIQQ